jgi:hypothetical protein
MTKLEHGLIHVQRFRIRGFPDGAASSRVVSGVISCLAKFSKAFKNPKEFDMAIPSWSERTVRDVYDKVLLSSVARLRRALRLLEERKARRPLRTSMLPVFAARCR